MRRKFTLVSVVAVKVYKWMAKFDWYFNRPDDVV